jgi:hypothetical protein
MSSPTDSITIAPKRADLHAACHLIASLRNSDELDSADIQSLLATAIRLYADHAAKREAPAPAFSADAVTATDAMVTITAVLKAVNLQVFELGMWQAWTAR